MDTVRFFAANTQPNPVEVDYWVDLYDNPYGGSIKYYNGTEWVRLAASGGIPDLSKYYTKVQVNQLLNDKASIQSVESKVDDEEVKDVVNNITFRTSNPNEVQWYSQNMIPPLLLYHYLKLAMFLLVQLLLMILKTLLSKQIFSNCIKNYMIVIVA